LTKTNEAIEPQENFSSERENDIFLTKTKSRRWIYTQPDLIKSCFICDNQIKVKYILPKKRYSQKNLWGHWTQKPTDQNKYICNSCLMKLHSGSMSDWITNKDKADNFYNYVYRGSFK
jgi:hypothetical protein